MSEAQTTLGDASSAELKQIEIEQLTLTEVRDIREPVVGEIKSRIQTSGYNPARPLRVVPDGDTYAVADGNHRLKALQELGVRDTVPCVVEPNRDLLAVAVESNQDEDTYAEPDLFDELDYIAREKERGLTLKEIIAKVDDWGEGYVKKRSRLLSNVVPRARDMARGAKRRLGTEKVPNGTFTEGWFRNSGLYDLKDGEAYSKPDEGHAWHPQARVMNWYISEENLDASKNQLTKKVEQVAEKCEQLSLIDEELQEGVGDETERSLREAATKGEYTTDTLRTAIKNANADAQDRAVFGVDALARLEAVEDNSIECVVMDPPYGEGFTSVRGTDNPDFDDEPDGVFEVLPELFEELDRVTTANAHVYMFFSMTHYERVYEEFSKWFDVNGTPLIWVKNRHAPKGPGSNGFEKGYAQKYEPILIGRGPKGDNRPLRAEEGGVCPNTLHHAVPTGDDRWHDTQKPRSLLRELITNSTATGETVLDPFAGSGATLLAAAEAGRHYVGFELEDKYESRFKREMREVKDE